jgi:hypothetical protein
MAAPARSDEKCTRYSELSQSAWHAAEAACLEPTHEIHEGLDLSAEICTVAARSLGDAQTVSLVVQFAIGAQQERPA